MKNALKLPKTEQKKIEHCERIQQLRNQVIEEKNCYQKTTDNITKENIMLQNELNKLHNEKLDLTK
jgi:hypothetical protein